MPPLPSSFFLDTKDIPPYPDLVERAPVRAVEWHGAFRLPSRPAALKDHGIHGEGEMDRGRRVGGHLDL